MENNSVIRKTEAERFFAYFRNSGRPGQFFSVLADAVAWGRSVDIDFDVSDRSGAIVWAWEMR